MTSINGKVAVVTGAGSGMGRELALLLAEKGAKVAISDVDPQGLAETERLLRERGAEVHSQLLNVAEREAVLTYADTVAEHFGKVNLVFNNAGIAFYGDVTETSYKDYDRVVDVDLWGVINGTKAFLPLLRESGDGHIINTSSLFGIIAVSGQSAYNAAKFGVRGFNESLRAELLAHKSDGVRLTSVHPGGVKTAVARNATFAEGYDGAAMANVFDKYLANTSARSAAEIIVKGVEKNKGRVLVGLDAKLLDLFVRVFPGSYPRIIAFVENNIISRIAKKTK